MAEVSATFNVDNGIAGLKRLTDEFQKVEGALQGVSLATASFNKAGNLTSGTVEAQVDAFTKLSQSFKNVKGELQLLATEYEHNSAAAQRNADRLEAISIRYARQEAKASEAYKKRLADEAAAAELSADKIERRAKKRALLYQQQQADELAAAELNATKIERRSQQQAFDYQQRQEKQEAIAAEKRLRLRDRFDASEAAARDKAYDKADKDRNKAIDKEIADQKRAREKAAKDAENPREPGFLEAAGTRFVRNAVQFGTFTLLNFIKNELIDGIKAAKDFEIQLSLIRTLSQGPEQQTAFKFGQDVRKVSDETGIDVNQVGKAFYDATSNQVAKGSGVKDFVKQAADFARVTGSTLPDSVNLLSGAINSYGKSAADAEKISAIFFRVIDEGRVVAGELANTFGRIGPLANSVGVSMEELGGILAITTQKGVKSADAVTLITNFLTKLEKPTEATKGFFKNILGVESGEAAIQVAGGIIPLIKLIVNEVKSGRVDVTAFFDEIRGRKQFAVFEQSIDQIEKFTAGLKDVGKTVEIYRNAVAIRGESPADQLNKEINKLSNVFKIDFGTAIVDSLAKFVQFTGGVEQIKNTVPAVTAGLKLLSFGILAVGIDAAIAFAPTISLSVAITAVGNAALLALRALGPYIVAAGAAYYAYEKGKKLFKAGDGGKFSDLFDDSKLDNTVQALERLAIARRKAQGQDYSDPQERFTKQDTKIDETFRSASQLIAGANKANNKLLEDAQAKSKEASDRIKVNFATITDSVKNSITAYKKGITDATSEIERSQKSLLKYKESGEEALYNYRLQFANDDIGEQKIRLTEERQKERERRSNELHAKGDEESLQEARRIDDELIKGAVEVANLKEALRQKQIERDRQANPDRYNVPGGNIITVSSEGLENDIKRLTERKERLEKDTQQKQKDKIKTDEKAVELGNRNLRILEESFKVYENIEILNKEGKVNSDFLTNGKFDQKKLDAALAKPEQAIRDASPKDDNTRFQLEQNFYQKRQALTKTAKAAETAEDLKSAEAKIQADRDASKQRLEDIKAERVVELKKQDDLQQAFNDKQHELGKFAGLVKAGGGLNEEQDKGLVDAIRTYQAALADLQNNKINAGGVQIFDPKKITALQIAYEQAADSIKAIDAKVGKSGGLSLSGFNIVGAKEAFGLQAREAATVEAKLQSNVQREAQENFQFDEKVAKPLAELRKQFPDLVVDAQNATKALNESFRSIASGGAEDLRKKLVEIRGLLGNGDNTPGFGKNFTTPTAPPAPPPPNIAPIAPVGPDGRRLGLGEFDNGVTYAATGGIVGMFPGQPRGVDIHPIWAATGETIVDARTSAMYRPMLQAIMNRRMPNYMAEGGVVGGDTQIGDINITVNGATTNSETARVVGNRLERQLRLNNIRLDRKKR